MPPALFTEMSNHRSWSSRLSSCGLGPSLNAIGASLHSALGVTANLSAALECCTLPRPAACEQWLSACRAHVPQNTVQPSIALDRHCCAQRKSQPRSFDAELTSLSASRRQVPVKTHLPTRCARQNCLCCLGVLALSISYEHDQQ
jgi:hypothetical protein